MLIFCQVFLSFLFPLFLSTVHNHSKLDSFLRGNANSRLTVEKRFIIIIVMTIA